MRGHPWHASSFPEESGHAVREHHQRPAVVRLCAGVLRVLTYPFHTHFLTGHEQNSSERNPRSWCFNSRKLWTIQPAPIRLLQECRGYLRDTGEKSVEACATDVV